MITFKSFLRESKIEAINRLINHPNTPEHERNAAKEALKRINGVKKWHYIGKGDDEGHIEHEKGEYYVHHYMRNSNGVRLAGKAMYTSHEMAHKHMLRQGLQPKP